MNGHTSAHCRQPDYSAPDWANAMTVHEVFRVVARRFEDRVAVVCGEDLVTYRELDRWSDAIASELIDSGLQPEDRVALAVPKSIAQIAAIFGILKAGGSYVPLVTNQPPERLRAVVADAGCVVAVTSAGYVDQALLGQVHAIDPLCLRSSTRRPPPRDIMPRNLAYIMYTSGSTGLPKGVMIEHEGVVRLVHGQVYMPFGPDFNFLYGGPLSFDLSTIEIYTPLLHGAKLIISDADVLSPEIIRRSVRDHGLSGICVSFSLFRALFRADAGAFERIPIIGVCGEAADPEFIRRAQERLTGAQFYNAYGPTECTALSTTYQIPRPCPSIPAIVPIGVPLGRMTVRVVDDLGRPVPDGQVGELRISGIGLARGYLNDPGLTEAKFLVDASTGRREYRSGDLVRVGPDGVVEYLGRADDQVKIRGQRIELGEIDAALNSDPDVISAASVVIGAGEDARIAACVELAAGPGGRTEPVLDRLRSRLTSAMMPTALVPVATLPINRNGKADRQAIKLLVSAFLEMHSPNLSPQNRPRTQQEHALYEQCCAALGVPSVDPSKSFVENGGNSLRAMMLRMRLRQECGIELSVPQILQSSNLVDLAHSATVAKAVRGTPDSDAGEQVGPVECTSAQARLWMVQQLDPSLARYNVAYQIRMSPDISKDAIESAWSSLFQRHPALRTAFRANPDGTAGAVLLPSVQAAVRWVQGPWTEASLRGEATRPFDLAEPPLARLVISSASGQGLLIVHHIVTDAWSMEIILRDLAVLYVSTRDGDALELPDPGAGSSVYASLRQTIEHDPVVLEKAEGMATRIRSRRVTRALASSDLSSSWRTETSILELSQNTRALLDRHSVLHGCTPQAILLASFAAWSARYCGTSDPTIGVAVSTRDDGPFADSVGFFVETVPLPFSLAGSTFVDVISQARELISQTHALKSVPFDHLVRLVGHADQPGRTPITDIFFNYIDRSPITGKEVADQVFAPEYVEFDHGLARFDLLCTVYRSDSSCRVVMTIRCGDWASIGPPPSAEGFIDFLSQNLSEVGDVLPSANVHSPKNVLPSSDTKLPKIHGDSVPTHEHLVWTIAGIYRNILGQTSFGPDDDFFASGGDSLKALQAFAAVRERFPTELTTSTMFRDSTPRKLAARLREESPALCTEAFLQITEPGRPYRGYILPGVTGDILSMRRLVDGLGSAWSCRAAMYPGVGTPRASFESLNEMLTYFEQAINHDYVPESSALIGYSFGGILGYELAVRLQQERRAPALLVIIDAHLLKKYPVRFKPVPVGLHLRNLKAMDRKARKKYLLKRTNAIKRRIQKLVRKPQGYDELPEVRNLTFANLRVVRDYQPSDRYTGQVLIVQGFRPDWMHTLEDDGANGWRRWLVKEPKVVSLKASHINLIKSDAAFEVANMIRQMFAEAGD